MYIIDMYVYLYIIYNIVYILRYMVYNDHAYVPVYLAKVAITLSVAMRQKKPVYTWPASKSEKKK